MTQPDHSVEALVNNVSSGSPEERERVRHNIGFLNDIDSRFSTRAARLFADPGAEGYSYARTFMRQWIAKHRDVPQARREALRPNPLAGKDYNEAGIALYDSILAFSVAGMGMDYLTEYTERDIFRSCKEGDFYLSRENAPRPDLFTASIDELKRHFRSTAVAAIILKVHRNEVEFVAQAPAFIAWMSTRENPDAVLAEAHRLGTLDIATLSTIMGMQRETPSALHSGLI